MKYGTVKVFYEGTVQKDKNIWRDLDRIDTYSAYCRLMLNEGLLQKNANPPGPGQCIHTPSAIFLKSPSVVSSYFDTY